MSERYYSPRTGPYEQYDDDYPCQICGMKIMSWLNWWKENPPQWGVTTEELEAQLEWCSDIRLLCDPDGEFEQLLPDFELRKMEKGFSTRQERDIQPKLRSRSQAPEIEVYGGEYRAGPIFTRHNSNGSPDLNIYQNYLFRTSDDKAYAASGTYGLFGNGQNGLQVLFSCSHQTYPGIVHSSSLERRYRLQVQHLVAYRIPTRELLSRGSWILPSLSRMGC